MKYKCEKCSPEPPCFLETGAEDCEWPFSCPYAIDNDDIEAEWKEYKDGDDMKLKSGKTCFTCGNDDETCSNCDGCVDFSKWIPKQSEKIGIGGNGIGRGWSCDECSKNDGWGRCQGCEDGSCFDRKDDPGPAPIKKPAKRGDILLDAHKIINGERQDSYGNPEDSFGLIGEYWTTYLQANGVIPKPGSIQISKREVAEMMMLFKIARMSGQKTTKDNYADLCGYAGIAADMVEGY